MNSLQAMSLFGPIIRDPSLNHPSYIVGNHMGMPHLMSIISCCQQPYKLLLITPMLPWMYNHSWPALELTVPWLVFKDSITSLPPCPTQISNSELVTGISRIYCENSNWKNHLYYINSWRCYESDDIYREGPMYGEILDVECESLMSDFCPHKNLEYGVVEYGS